ncbi:MoaF-related domain-containing protein [Streptomyces albireticuli]|uniref:MoaF-like domain-containing protein n=1 Tax=Streptomyces albireticuli TaxID=1940 RepID=A0A2A2CXL4_9ACTN|nr:hypothetical protein [Streptomyces albireticuli]MCD9145373.1 hypothetical protein [Streptomyces albireticuli]MCD9165062.1 hypothetical protein [Streptomyces albireticuli]MCD9195347.1 hypothetical protein [Streptomyces albireticuli]PAU44948.1 hypothetical protein CK936_32135 [Streptomyces albireticuli]
MKIARFIRVAVPLSLALCCTGTLPAEAQELPAPRGGVECRGWEREYEDAAMPAVGQTWTLDFGSDTPIGPGPFVATIHFTDESRATIKVTQGPAGTQGLTQDITYTSTRLRPCQYAVTWHEPKTGLFVTQVEDFAQHRAYDTIVDPAKGTMIHMTATFFRGQ